MLWCSPSLSFFTSLCLSWFGCLLIMLGLNICFLRMRMTGMHTCYLSSLSQYLWSIALWFIYWGTKQNSVAIYQHHRSTSTNCHKARDQVCSNTDMEEWEPDTGSRKHHRRRQERTASQMPRTEDFKWEVSASDISIVQKGENIALKCWL